ncbi:hypothetical protein F2Q70_00025620 [Brassica cretica]|uniref:Uncharacterized protein n=1 Tax=Brassica cretica TaxID=69181 RepID=A0A8S9LCC6_BRACR|nr:hypothetical protein F2Q70_00025620 [Brassica cretica]
MASPQSLTGLWSWWSRSAAAVVFVLLYGGVGNLAQWPGSCGFVSFLKGCRLWLLRGCSLPHHFEYPCFVSLHNLWGRRRSGFSEVQRLFGQSSVTISTRSLAVWCLGALYISTRCYEALSKLFSDGSLSLRADRRGSQNYRVLALG